MKAHSAEAAVLAIIPGQTAPGYLVYGEEAYWHQRFIEALSASFPSGGETLAGDEVTWDSLRDVLSQPSFFGPQLWVIREAQNVFREADERYLGSISDGTCLLLSCTVKDNPAPKAFLEKWDRMGGCLVEAAEPSFAEASSWVADRFRADGFRVSPDAVENLITITGRSIERLQQEVLKIEAYVGKGDIGLQAVLQCASADPEKTSFGLIDAVAARNAPKAFSEYLDLKSRGANAIAIVALLGSHFGLVWRVKEAERKKIAQAALPKFLGVHPYAAKKASSEARNWTFPQIETAQRVLCAVDENLKRGRMDPDRAMDYLLSTLCLK